MKEYNVAYIENIAEEIIYTVNRGHIEDEDKSNVICNYKMFGIIAKNQNGDFIGLLTAYIAYAEIYVDDIWVNPTYRKLGVGKALLDKLENRFNNKGYNNINLVTSQFQAVDFYKKCGYTCEHIRHNKYNPQFTKYFMIKYFDNKVQYQGIKE